MNFQDTSGGPREKSAGFTCTDVTKSLREQAQSLPNAPGVYRFHGGDGGSLVYVGKSIDLRKRVMSHLSAASSQAREKRLVDLSNRLSYRVTPGELSALLLESEEVKQSQPLLNRQLRRQKRLLTYQLDTSPSGVTGEPQGESGGNSILKGSSALKGSGLLHPKLVAASWPPACATSTYFGLFSSKTHAQKRLRALAAEHQLCLVVLGLEQSTRSCFGYQLRRCLGACVGEESVTDHNTRLVSAIAADAIRVWPYAGPVGILETPEASHISIVDQWYYLGCSDNVVDASNRAQQGVGSKTLLDRDAYRIVSRWLLAPPPGARIIVLNGPLTG
jgi:DNA polymerase-3 subunit epsilon